MSNVDRDTLTTADVVERSAEQIARTISAVLNNQLTQLSKNGYPEALYYVDQIASACRSKANADKFLESEGPVKVTDEAASLSSGSLDRQGVFATSTEQPSADASAQRTEETPDATPPSPKL